MVIEPRQDISIIVCAYTDNRWEEMIAALYSLQHQTVSPLEIILVIDHNPKLFQRAVQKFQGVIILENQSLRGLSGARNTGIASARGSLIAFMDEDAVAEPDWTEKILAMYADPAVLGVGGAIRPAWARKKPAWFPEEFNWVVGCTYKGLPETAAPVRNLIGCNMSFRRDVFDKAGGFRTGMGRIGTLPVGCEETELCIRATRHFSQSVLLYVPGAQVWHHVPAVRARWGYFIHRCYSEGISKAQVAHFVGVSRGLASERTYTYRTLPAGVLRGISDFFFHGDPTGMARVFAIVLGLACTTAGYLAGKGMEVFHAPTDPEAELIRER
jgi:glucosyl-dolichyl phosphate glucuronosyltransferase